MVSAIVELHAINTIHPSIEAASRIYSANRLKHSSNVWTLTTITVLRADFAFPKGLHAAGPCKS
jgi:hypothetical protein